MRRSARARIIQPPAPLPPTYSSSSLSSVSRAERNTRSNNKVPSPQNTAAQQSESLPELEGSVRGEAPTTRRSKRRDTNDHHDRSGRAQAKEDEEEVEAEEITRCLCGHAEYPGPPPLARELIRQQSTKPAGKEENAQKAIPPPASLSEDAGNFFIQCDSCQVWQHGGCVGLMDESMSPDEYFCETCRPEYHRRHKNPVGPPSSRYLPVLETASAESSSSSLQNERPARKNGRSRQMANPFNTKRRATMNSRDAAYDEDEMLRRAIEESRETGPLGKRLRDESEEVTASASKRRRLSSNSSSPPKTLSSSRAISEDRGSKAHSNGANGGRKGRGASARGHRETETRDRQMELAVQRAEAASKRNARSERRRAEDSSPPTPTLSPRKDAAQSTTSHKPGLLDTPSHRGNNPSNHRKPTGRPAARRGRLGRNQYTRDQSVASGRGGGTDTPKRSNSRDPGARSSPFPTANAVTNGINGESGRSSRPKYHHPNRTSMNEMKRRVAAILEFISRMQDHGKDGRNNSHRSSSGPSGSRTPNKAAHHVPAAKEADSNALQAAALLKGVEAGLSSASTTSSSPAAHVPPGQIVSSDGAFQEMGSVEMRHLLTRELLSWQSLYGKYGER